VDVNSRFVVQFAAMLPRSHSINHRRYFPPVPADRKGAI
jgi:hypothetical protein